MDIQKDYNLDDFKISQEIQLSPVKKQVLKVPVRKPDKSWFIRVHPDATYRSTVYTLEISDSGGKELYLIFGPISAEIFTEFHQYVKAQTIHTAITKTGDVFLWPIPQVGPDGKDLSWWESAREGAKAATEKWTRIVANLGLGAYDAFIAQGQLADPTWPDEDFKTLLLKGFKGKIIDNLDHEALNKLRGLV